MGNPSLIMETDLITFEGNHRDIGSKYGKAFTDSIRKNLSILIWREGYEPLPREDAGFIAWHDEQESILAKNWPWLLEEMTGVAEGAGVKYEDILLLNLRAWQYNYYGESPGQACSSFAVTLDDGNIACAGALDDPIEYYCGPVCFNPDGGYSCITFPITGTSWASRSLNEKGLAIGISSQVLPGLKKLDNTINQDLAVRIIMQSCTSVDEVREFCKEYPFTINIVCVDAKGCLLCGHHTAAGLFEISFEDDYAAITNHIVNNSIKERLATLGVSEFPESDTTHARRKNLIMFAHQHNRKCTAAEVMDFISTCDENNQGSINRHNGGTAYLTFANPQNDPKTFWIMQPYGIGSEKQFKQFRITSNG